VVRCSLSGSITGLFKSGIDISLMVVGATHHSPGGQDTVPGSVTVSGGLSISIRLDG
jgi:hypothetical protein